MRVAEVNLRANGRCECGAIHYRVTAQPYVAYTYHCRACQQLSESGLTSCAQFAAEALTLMHGAPVPSSCAADSGNRLTTSFCAICGTTLNAERFGVTPAVYCFHRLAGKAARPGSDGAHLARAKAPTGYGACGPRQFAGGADWSADFADAMERYRPGA